MTQANPLVRTVSIQHVTLVSDQPFDAVRARLEARVPPIDETIFTRLRNSEDAQARQAIEAGPPLSIFATQDHGALLRAFGHDAKAIQYLIGNPLTASRMTRQRLSAALYAPVRVLLREAAGGTTVFEYDSPLSVFGQFGDSRVEAVARALDAELHEVLRAAAGQA